MRGESGVNFSLFLLLLSVRPGNPVSLRRRRVKETKGRRVKETKGRRDKETKRQRVKERDKETKGQRVKETKGRRVKESKRLKVKETKGQRDEERKRQRDEKTKTASPPIRVLFTAQFVQFLFNSCPKTFARFVSKTVLHNRTPLCESSVKVDVGGKL